MWGWVRHVTDSIMDFLWRRSTEPKRSVDADTDRSRRRRLRRKVRRAARRDGP